MLYEDLQSLLQKLCKSSEPKKQLTLGTQIARKHEPAGLALFPFLVGKAPQRVETAS